MKKWTIQSIIRTCSSEENFKILSIHFTFSLFISPWKSARSFIWTNFNPLNTSAKDGWNWPSGHGSEEEEEEENVKSLRQWRRRLRRQRPRRCTTDKLGSEKVTWVIGSGELKSKNRTQDFIIYPLNHLVLLIAMLFLWAGTSRPIIWNKNLKSLCVSAGWIWYSASLGRFVPRFVNVVVNGICQGLPSDILSIYI